MNLYSPIPEGLVSGIGEPDRSTIIDLWRVSTRLVRHGQYDRARACCRRIIEIKNPHRVSAGTTPL